MKFKCFHVLSIYISMYVIARFSFNEPYVYTGEAMKAYKSLDAYKYFVSGKVNDVLVWRHSNTKDNKHIYVIRSKVKHSMAIRNKAVSVWVAVQEEGTVITGHCDCMAGVSEVCSHVAATLFYMGQAAATSCTSKPSLWNRPLKRKPQKPYAEGSAINFKRPKKPLLDNNTPPKLPKTAATGTSLKQPTVSQKDTFYKMMRDSGIKPAFLSIVKGYTDPYIPSVVALNLPSPLCRLFRTEYMQLSHHDLTKKCEEEASRLAFSTEQVAALEKTTRLQSKSNTWFEYRAGRITASNFRAAVSTNPVSPSVSLIKRICYPEAYKFSTAATRWGCQHESTAINSYKEMQVKDHDSLKVGDSGFHIHAEHTFLGATPDGLVTCKCCGEGILEVKCPMCVKDKTFESEADQQHRQFCLELRGQRLQLKHSHPYYFQFSEQTQGGVVQNVRGQRSTEQQNVNKEHLNNMAGNSEGLLVFFLLMALWNRQRSVRRRRRRRLAIVSVRRRRRRMVFAHLAIEAAREASAVERTLCFRDRSQHWWENDVLNNFSDKDWIENFRMRRTTFDFICTELSGRLTRQNTRFREAISVTKRVGVALWYLATGADYRTLSHLFGVGRSTVCIIVREFP
uniref:SWIM-type domain-containing protein n=1 Tax=Branchiostoma floridae TaxID=7739 RepID=C3XPA9_BRAFL|eukprot:XP_002613771.1 hypothetical protein BRAFLDRAFT_85312 [Branchiostoma floridae]